MVGEAVDPLLMPLVAIPSREAARTFLADFIRIHADPVIRAIILYKLGFSSSAGARQADVEDLHQESVLQLVAELQKFQNDPDSHPIMDARGLAAVIAHRACARWMRRRFPERHALKNRLYYILTHRRDFDVWRNSSNTLVAGFAKWKAHDMQPVEGPIELIGITVFRDEFPSALEAVFKRLNRPVEFDQLVSTLAALLQIDNRSVGLTEHDENAMRIAASQEPDPALHVEKRIFLERLWEELRILPRHQRAALLLNLRDSQGTNCIELFPLTGIASMRQLADALEIPVDTLAQLWNDLPLGDARIAELLQLNRQQVINARKSARERLTRQLKGFI